MISANPLRSTYHLYPLCERVCSSLPLSCSHYTVSQLHLIMQPSSPSNLNPPPFHATPFGNLPWACTNLPKIREPWILKLSSGLSSTSCLVVLCFPVVCHVFSQQSSKWSPWYSLPWAFLTWGALLNMPSSLFRVYHQVVKTNAIMIDFPLFFLV